MPSRLRSSSTSTAISMASTTSNVSRTKQCVRCRAASAASEIKPNTFAIGSPLTTVPSSAARTKSTRRAVPNDREARCLSPGKRSNSTSRICFAASLASSKTVALPCRSPKFELPKSTALHALPTPKRSTNVAASSTERPCTKQLPCLNVKPGRSAPPLRPRLPFATPPSETQAPEEAMRRRAQQCSAGAS